MNWQTTAKSNVVIGSKKPEIIERMEPIDNKFVDACFSPILLYIEYVVRNL